MFFRIRTWNRLTRYLAKRYKTANLWLNVWDEKYEFDTEYDGYVKPRQFLWLFFKAWINKKICWHCNGGGMTGYYEPEACRVCYGFGINWTGEQEPDWEAMAKGMREMQLADESSEMSAE